MKKNFKTNVIFLFQCLLLIITLAGGWAFFYEKKKEQWPNQVNESLSRVAFKLLEFSLPEEAFKLLSLHDSIALFNNEKKMERFLLEMSEKFFIKQQHRASLPYLLLYESLYPKGSHIDEVTKKIISTFEILGFSQEADTLLAQKVTLLGGDSSKSNGHNKRPVAKIFGKIVFEDEFLSYEKDLLQKIEGNAQEKAKIEKLSSLEKNRVILQQMMMEKLIDHQLSKMATSQDIQKTLDEIRKKLQLNELWKNKIPSQFSQEELSNFYKKNPQYSSGQSQKSLSFDQFIKKKENKAKLEEELRWKYLQDFHEKLYEKAILEKNIEIY